MDTKKAFDYEQGQFICHLYAELGTEICDTLDELSEQLMSQQTSNPILKEWKPIQTTHVRSDSWHVTLLRGHRAVHRHQIEALVSLIKTECDSLEPFNICLDVLDVFSNFEKTKQFLVIAERHSSAPNITHSALKQALRTSIDKFAIKLTDEDETNDTRAHCSLLTRDLNQTSIEYSETSAKESLQLVEEICLKCMERVPICVTRIDRIHIKIGNHVYDIKLGV